jgi:hypothetical protein
MARAKKTARKTNYSYIPKIEETTVSKTIYPSKLHKINEDLILYSASEQSFIIDSQTLKTI